MQSSKNRKPVWRFNPSRNYQHISFLQQFSGVFISIPTEIKENTQSFLKGSRRIFLVFLIEGKVKGKVFLSFSSIHQLQLGRR
jgi:hypothetical protein